MTLTDFVWISVGELLLAGTFALGILVGVALKPRKESHGHGNEGTESIHIAEHVNAEGRACGRDACRAGQERKANTSKRQAW